MIQNDKIRIDVTSALFRERDGAARLNGIKKACRNAGFELGIQLHNTSTVDEIMASVDSELPFTAHIPLLCDWQINLATRNLEASLDSLEKSVELMRQYEVTSAVLHGFVMTDSPIPAFGRGRSYDDAMRAIVRPELGLPGSRICGDFFGTAEFAERRELTRDNLAEIARRYPDIDFLIENDFPCYGAGNLLADCAVTLNNDMCLDSSHLWATSFVFDRDFMTEAEAFLHTGRVKMVHLHASAYTAATPKANWGDGHLPLTTPNQMRLPEFVRCCRRAGVMHYVLEIREVTAADIDCFVKMWNSTESLS